MRQLVIRVAVASATTGRAVVSLHYKQAARAAKALSELAEA